MVLAFSEHKLNAHELHYLQRLLDDYTYSCKSTLGELDLGGDFKDVEFWDHACGDVFEKLYYSAGLKPAADGNKESSLPGLNYNANYVGNYVYVCTYMHTYKTL